LTDSDDDHGRRAWRLRAYEELRKDRPELFVNVSGGAFTIEFGRDEQDTVAAAQRRSMGDAGLPPDYGDVGVVYQDEYLLLVRDAVRFRDGRLGSYVRFLPAGATGGSVVLPLIDDDVLLVSHYRHATRTWLWEAPRGFPGAGEEPAETAVRELTEELHVVPADLRHLGTIQPDTGITSSAVDIFAARVTGLPLPDPLEGIDDVRRLSPTELDRWIAEGRISDGYTLAACALARARGILSPGT
jgi:ADP-ribose pyrophosphatase